MFAHDSGVSTFSCPVLPRRIILQLLGSFLFSAPPSLAGLSTRSTPTKDPLDAGPKESFVSSLKFRRRRITLFDALDRTFFLLFSLSSVTLGCP